MEKQIPFGTYKKDKEQPLKGMKESGISASFETKKL